MKSLKLTLTFSLLLIFGLSNTLASAKGNLEISYTKTDVSCFGKANGKIELTVIGGKAPYKVEWNTGSQELILENLKKGVYQVTITDAQERIISENIAIDAPAPLSIVYGSKKETLVDIVNGSMDVAISGGTPWDVNDSPYYFIRLNGTSTIENPTELEDGVYKINVEDSKGCSLNVPVNLNIEVATATGFGPVEEENAEKPYNGMGYVNMTIYRANGSNIVSMKDSPLTGN